MNDTISLCLVPRQLFEMIKAGNGSMADLVNIDVLYETYGKETVARYVLLNDLYDNGLGKNIYPKLEDFNLGMTNLLARDLNLANTKPDILLNIKNRVDGLRITSPDFKLGQYPDAKVEYLEVFRISSTVLGVTTVDEGGPVNDDSKLTKRRVINSIIGTLYKNGVGLQTLYKSNLYKETIRIATACDVALVSTEGINQNLFSTAPAPYTMNTFANYEDMVRQYDRLRYCKMVENKHVVFSDFDGEYTTIKGFADSGNADIDRVLSIARMSKDVIQDLKDNQYKFNGRELDDDEYRVCVGIALKPLIADINKLPKVEAKFDKANLQMDIDLGDISRGTWSEIDVKHSDETDECVDVIKAQIQTLFQVVNDLTAIDDTILPVRWTDQLSRYVEECLRRKMLVLMELLSN